jgi:hypothetical protein
MAVVKALALSVVDDGRGRAVLLERRVTRELLTCPLTTAAGRYQYWAWQS